MSKLSSTNSVIFHQERKDPWKDLSAIIMEEKYKAEERREIIGEEWRKISRILDKFLLIVFTCASLITTLWCIFVSPHYPDADAEMTGDGLVSLSPRSPEYINIWNSWKNIYNTYPPGAMILVIMLLTVDSRHCSL